MNKYLLLRDNKQSGPYTVPEIIAIGIKPYDLVWLEGKSAAWRYPSEIDELKAHAPSVEEQPFDRFYKKPEPAREARQAETISHQHADYEPRVTVTTVEADPQTSRKVYINFPGSGPKPVVTEPKKERSAEPVVSKEVSKATPVLFPERTLAMESYDEKPSWNTNSDRNTSVPVNQPADKKFLYGAVAACIILLAFIGVLLINYSNQQKNLKELNTIVHQMENRAKAPLENIPATLVSNEAPAAQTSETIINPEALDIAPEKTVTETTPSIKENPATVHSTVKNNAAASGIVFKETKPVDNTEAQKAAGEVKNAAPATTSTENLFKLVSIKPNNYKTGVLGGISNLQLELTNNSLHELHKVAVEIKYLGPEKKVVKRQTVYFENVSPGSQTTLDVPKSNRGVTIDYIITDIKS